jgi:hypothetical protein
MAATDSTAFPVHGQPFRVRLAFYDPATGLLISGGLSGLAATISKDDGSAVATTNTPTESGMPGVVYLDLTATEMTASGVVVYVTSTNGSAFAQSTEIVPLRLTEQSGAALDQTQVLFEQVVLDIMAAAINLNTLSGSTYTIYKRDNTSKLSGSYTQGTETAQRGKLS